MDRGAIGALVGSWLSAHDAMMGVMVSRSLIPGIGLAAAAWLVGLALFAMHIQDLAAPTMTDLDPADAIIVLTGGSERVKAGFDLLQAGKGKKLLISGVHHGLTLEQILAGQSVPDILRQQAVVLGHAAGSTIGNAEETRAWMISEGYRSFLLVTANYHMPRSLLIFRAALPDMRIIPYPIMPDNLALDGWWHHAGSASLLVTEYNKYLLAHLRLLMGGGFAT